MRLFTHNTDKIKCSPMVRVQKIEEKRKQEIKMSIKDPTAT